MTWSMVTGAAPCVDRLWEVGCCAVCDWFGMPLLLMKWELWNEGRPLGLLMSKIYHPIVFINLTIAEYLKGTKFTAHSPRRQEHR
jgi:hypothetical protein